MSDVSGKPTISQRIANLPFLRVVDTMLLEGTSAAQVAHFIHDDQSEMKDVPHKTLSNALAKRKNERAAVLDIPMDVPSEDDWFSTGIRPNTGRSENRPQKPSVLARAAYKRTEGGIQEVLELEALYMAQRDRIDRLMDLEFEVGAFSDKTGHEVSVAGDLLMKRLSAREKCGMIGNKGRGGDVHDIKGYSKETAEVLSRPDSRRRVISIVERIKRMQETKFSDDDDVPEESSEAG